MLNRAYAARVGYWLCIAVILAVGAGLRINYADLGRDPIVGDETTYLHAARSLIDHGTLIRDVEGTSLRSGDVSPTAALSPGYPLFIAAVLLAGGGLPAVLAANVVLSIGTLLLLFLLMRGLAASRLASLVGVSAAAFYPGMILNLDRVLTEQLFVALFVAFFAACVRGFVARRLIWMVVAGLLLGLATHVRAQAIPFALITLVFSYVLLPRQEAHRFALAFVAALLVMMSPWWLRNALAFDRFIFLTDAGEGAAIWGAVPYFIDMGSSAGSLAEVIQRNMTPAPDVYYRWRIFGFLQFMWGDVWNERLAHPEVGLRPLLLLHPFAVVLPIVAAPLLALRRDPLPLMVASVPVAVTLLAAPFHGLPRYALPAVPFAFLLLAALLTGRRERRMYVPVADWQKHLERIVRWAFLGVSALFSVLLVYTLAAFSWSMSEEMSSYRLARYLGTSIGALQTPVASHMVDLKAVDVENTRVIRPGRVMNNVDAPPIIKISIPQLGGSAAVVTEVTLNIKGGFYFDRTTVYWTGTRTPTISENAYYKYPTNPLISRNRMYIDEDVDHLMIVPFVFRWGKMDLDSVIVRKYRLE